jgi:hypothetical protein
MNIRDYYYTSIFCVNIAIKFLVAKHSYNHTFKSREDFVSEKIKGLDQIHCILSS